MSQLNSCGNSGWRNAWVRKADASAVKAWILRAQLRTRQAYGNANEISISCGNGCHIFHMEPCAIISLKGIKRHRDRSWDANGSP